MTVRAHNVVEASINDVTEVAFSSESITLVDYVVDTENYEDDIRYDLQPNGAYVFRLTLHPDIRQLQERGVVGYSLSITNEDTEEEIYRVEDVQFRDDFPELMNTGELDIDEIASQINRTREFLVAEEAAIESGFITGDLTSRVNRQYVDLNKSSEFSSLARTYLQAGLDPDDAAQFSMPVFAMPSSAMSIGAVENSSNRFDASAGKMTKFQINRGTRQSLNDTREKIQAEINRSAPSSYKIEQSVVPISENIGSEIVLGKKIKASSFMFESTRYFEVSKPDCESNNLIFSITPIVRPIDAEDELDDFVEPQETSVSFPIRASRESLFEPEVPPEVSVFVNNPYEISFAIDKKRSSSYICLYRKVLL